MKKLKELLEDRARVLSQLDKINTEARERDLTDDEAEKIENLAGALGGLDSDIATARRAEARDTARRALEQRREQDLGGQRRESRDAGDQLDEHMAELREFLTTGRVTGSMEPDREQRATSTSSVSAMVPLDVARKFYDLMDKAAIVGRIATFESFIYDTNLPRAATLAEDAAPTTPTAEAGAFANVDPNAAAVQIRNSKKGTSTAVSHEIIERSSTPIEQRILTAHAQAQNRYWEGRFLFGDGTGEPEGVFISNADTAQFAAGATLTEDDFIEALTEHMPSEAWDLPMAWLCRDQATFAEIAKIEDGAGRKLIRMNREEGLSGRVVPNILGFPVHVGRGGVALGDDDPRVVLATSMSYLINRPGSMSILRDPYTLGGQGQIRYLVHLFQDGRWFFPEYTVQILSPSA